jgi:DNA-binding response OmpR family regulator
MSKVVIVEDDKLVALIYENKLKAEGHQVSVAHDGVTGFKMIQEIKPDMILLDLMLPNMSGIDIIKRLRSDAAFENVQIIAYSGATDDYLQEATLARPTKVFSKKQHSHKEIVAHLKEVLGTVTQTNRLDRNVISRGSDTVKKNKESIVEESVPPAQFGSNSKRVLVVEDDLIIARIVSSVLDDEGYFVVHAKDGREAQRILKSDSNFVAGVFDLDLPHVKGTEIVRNMRNDNRLSRIPVMIMTANDDHKVQLDSFSAGAVLFLPKPFTRSTLKIMFTTLVKTRLPERAET